MAVTSQGARVAIQIVLAIAIIGLAYYLYVSITEPYNVIERQEELTRQTRERMTQIRTAQVEFEKRYDYFTGSLDTLVIFLKDSLTEQQVDSLYSASFVPDSLPFSPRTGNRFVLSINDTLSVDVYLLEDPDSDDQIGTLTADVTQVNAASWE